MDSPDPDPIPLRKSDSNASHISLPVTGAHPLGTLQVHRADDRSPPLSRRVLTKPLPQSPGTLLVLDLPPNATVGFDEAAFRSKSFSGVRDVPPGAHFLWASATESTSMRSGVWFLVAPEQHAHVVQWDRYNEVLDEPAATEARIQRDNLPSTLPSLTPYDSLAPQRDPEEWSNLTRCITPAVLARVTSKPSGPWHFHTTDRVRGASVLASEAELEKRISVVAVSELAFRFAQTGRTYDISAIGAARTEAATDATAYIDAAIADGPEEDLIGELQLAFLLGMHLGNESCVHQWWHTVLSVFLKAHNLPLHRPSLTRLFLETLTAQLSYDSTRLEGSVLDFGADQAKNTRLALTIYKRRLTELLLNLGASTSTEQAAVGKAFDALETLVWRFDWDLKGDYVRSGKVTLEDGEEVEVEMDELVAEDERGEYAPAVVDLDGEGRQRDLVSWR